MRCLSNSLRQARMWSSNGSSLITSILTIRSLLMPTALKCRRNSSTSVKNSTLRLKIQLRAISIQWPPQSLSETTVAAKSKSQFSLTSPKQHLQAFETALILSSWYRGDTKLMMMMDLVILLLTRRTTKAEVSWPKAIIGWSSQR